MNNIFSGTKTTIQKIFSEIKNIPFYVKLQIRRLKREFTDFRSKLKNITQSNIDVGIYHLRSGHYNDAILRFKLVDKYLDPNNKIANYRLGWAYLLKKNYDSALLHLAKAGEEDKIGLMNFIKNVGNIEEIPPKIYSRHRKIRSKFFVDKFADEDNNIPFLLIHEFNKAIDRLPDEYEILELGSNIGLLGYEIRKRAQESFRLSSTEISQEMIDLQSVLYPQRQLYDEILCISVNDFFINNNKKFDVIFSLDGFSFTSNLTKIFKNIYSCINEGGYFAFVIRSTNNVILSPDLLEFSYDSREVISELEETGFKILAFKEFNLEIKNKYSIFVCKKIFEEKDHEIETY